MSLIKRIVLFLITNIAIIVAISILLFIIERVFGISISWYWVNYTSLFIFALIWWFVWSFISLFMSKWMAKRAYNIQIIWKDDVYNLWNKERVVWQVVEELSERHKIKMPEVGIYTDSEPNAFATGATKNSALVAVSSWLLDNMTKDEIEWVIGHEMAHVLNWDMVTMTLLQWVLNTFVIFFARILANIVDSVTNKDSDGLGWWYYLSSILFEILLWFLASMIAMWFSRYREFKADEGSAKFVWKYKMIDALKALQKMEPVLIHTTDTEDQKFAAFKIESKKGRGIASLFASHPSLEDRIKHLEELRID